MVRLTCSQNTCTSLRHSLEIVRMALWNLPPPFHPPNPFFFFNFWDFFFLSARSLPLRGFRHQVVFPHIPVDNVLTECAIQHIAWHIEAIRKLLGSLFWSTLRGSYSEVLPFLPSYLAATLICFSCLGTGRGVCEARHGCSHAWEVLRECSPRTKAEV